MIYYYNCSGSIGRDGVGVSILKQDRNTRAQGFQDLQGQRPEDVRNIATLAEEEHNALVGRLVFIDPGRRDVFFTMHEDSTPEDPLTYRYTANQLRKETKHRKYTSLVARSKPRIVQQSETFSSQNSAKFNSISSFNDHLNARVIESGPMRSFYEDLVVTGGLNHRGHNPPLIRKLKFHRYKRRQQAGARLVRTLLEQYKRVGENGQTILPAFVIEDWSAGNARFHEPVPTKRLTRMLVKQGLEIHKIWEPSCQCKPQTASPGEQSHGAMLGPAEVHV
ncbi:hypothetical protein BC940DRAFT_330438 [Gongronella butleri]|nr:hypothetical protein BC940DRAFT_330438 [Gongronella butleri]